MTNGCDLIWFAMRATYRREIKAKEYLNNHSIDSFVPMRYEITQDGKYKNQKLVSAISNLIFVRSTESRIKEIKQSIPYLKHILDVVDGKMIPMVVPDFQMERFIAVVSISEEQVTYLDPEQIDFTKGEQVIITGGIFKGKEGTFVKINGKRSKQVVVAIKGIVAVAIASIHPSLISKIDTLK